MSPKDKGNWSQVYDRIVAMRGDEFDRIPEADLERLYKGSPEVKKNQYEIEKKRILAFANVVKRMRKDEFVTYMNSGELPVLKLNNAELAVVSGGQKSPNALASLLFPELNEQNSPLPWPFRP
jgi:hypothetical protein